LDIFLQILFWLSVFALFHSYVLFPFLLKIQARNKQDNTIIYEKIDDLPKVSILISVFNEEEVISDKINSIYKTTYPINKIEVIVGSDDSSDNTNRIINELKKKFRNLHFFEFNERQGKQNIINKLYSKTIGNIIILTDANVMFVEDTIFELIKHFKNENIGLVDSMMINSQDSINKKGISIQESSYISREVNIKKYESLLNGTMMGPFGGCFAIRKELFSEVPANFLVDDFFINMNILKNGKKAINNLNAIVYEDVSNNIKEEFRRKVRISAGNFQNLIKFFPLLFSKRKGLSYYFFSHKVIRWFGPLLIIISLITNFLLYNILLYKITIFFFLLSFAIPLIDLILKTFKINISIFRYFTHFYTMNIALIFGFIKYLFGIRTGIWQPTGRNQSKK
jgi:cellulose synthase/poly-beta-1,6-N-acetylglucosamine synthase-like glycosyltransferase